MKVKFEKVLERDIDLMLINKFISDTNFKNLFLKKINKHNYSIYSIEHSVMNEYGESDIVVILQKATNKVALLIEDKIDAIAMQNQHERYLTRGNNDILNKKYDDFFIFILAPKDYLENNTEAKKYENKISYECLADYLKNDLYASTLLKQAIEEKKNGYVVIENKNVTNFWSDYYRFVKNNYPMLNLIEIKGPRGSNACWPEFKTPFKQIKIIHKSNKGYVDMCFSNINYNLFFKTIFPILEKDMSIEQTGKSISIRIKTPLMDFKQNFNDYINEVTISFKAVLRLIEFLRKIDLDSLSLY